MKIKEMWVKIFSQNEKYYAQHRASRVLTDEQISALMCKTFPKHKNSRNFLRPQGERVVYNRGLFTGGKKPEPQSCKYVREGKKLKRIVPRTRKKE